MELKYKHLLLGLLLVLVGLITFYPHYTYTYPLHVDEWQHLAQARSVYTTGELSKVNPYFVEGDTYESYEHGFQVFLAMVLYNIGFDPVLAYKFLPALFMLLGAISLFVLVSYLFKNYWIALLSVVFYLSLKSNVNIYGPWFFVPLTFALPFVAVFLLTLLKGINEDRRYLLFASLIAALILAVHPITITFLFPVLAIYFLMSNNTNKFILSGLFFALSIVGAFVIQFQYGWGIVEINYLLPEFFGWGASVMAIIGLIVCMKKKQHLMPIWVLVTLLMIYVFILFDIAFLAPYQRLIFYLLLGMIPLAALGTYTLATNINSKMIVGVFIAALLVSSFYNYLDLPSNAELYYMIDSDQYALIKMLPEESIVVASQTVSTAATPISGAKVYTGIIANLKQSGRAVVNDYFDEPCESTLAFDYAIHDQKIDCDDVTLVEQQGRYRLYRKA